MKFALIIAMTFATTQYSHSMAVDCGTQYSSDIQQCALKIQNANIGPNVYSDCLSKADDDQKMCWTKYFAAIVSVADSDN